MVIVVGMGGQGGKEHIAVGNGVRRMVASTLGDGVGGEDGKVTGLLGEGGGDNEVGDAAVGVGVEAGGEVRGAVDERGEGGVVEGVGEWLSEWLLGVEGGA